MKTSVVLLAAVTLFVSTAHAQRLQCLNKEQGTRNVLIQGGKMTVVNPRTPNIVFVKQASIETRGNITKAITDAWEIYLKDGHGHLTNLTFDDKYTCIQTGS